MKEHQQNSESRLWDFSSLDLTRMGNLSNVCPLFPQLRNPILPVLWTKIIIQISQCTVGITGQDTKVKYLQLTKSYSICFPN